MRKVNILFYARLQYLIAGIVNYMFVCLDHIITLLFSQHLGSVIGNPSIIFSGRLRPLYC
jgi:hypothetical protein